MELISKLYQAWENMKTVHCICYQASKISIFYIYSYILSALKGRFCSCLWHGIYIEAKKGSSCRVDMHATLNELVMQVVMHYYKRQTFCAILSYKHTWHGDKVKSFNLPHELIDSIVGEFKDNDEVTSLSS